MSAPVLNLPVQHRSAAIRAASYRDTDNSIEVVFTTGATVRRVSWAEGTYDEVLEVTPAAVKLDRLNAGAPFLDTHDAYDLSRVLGSVVPGSARIEKGRGYARIQLSDAPDVASSVAKIREGTVKNISVGYRVIRVEKTEAAKGAVAIHRVTEWEPMEISAVPIPADPGAQVRADQQLYPAFIVSQEGAMPAKNIPAADPAAVEADRARMATITELATRAGLPDMISPAIAAGTDVDRFRADLLDRLVQDENRMHPGGPGMQTAPPATVADHSFDQRRAAAMQSAILHRVDPQNFKLEHGGEVFMTMPLLEIARAAVEGRGVRTAGMSKLQIAGAALEQRSLGGLHGTSDFPTILAGVTNRTLRAAYEAVPQTFRPFTRIGFVPDFKEVSRVSIGEAPQFEKVNEHGEFKRGTIGEAGEKYRIETYGRVIGITRQALINDDLAAFDRIPRAFGVQAAQLESDLVWAQIIGNPTMGDGTTLFHANHKNLLTAGAIGEATVSEARLKMGLMTGLDGKTVLNLSPAYIIVPKSLQTAAEKFLTTIYPTKEADATPAALKNLTIIAEPRLDAGIARYKLAGSASNYYFAAQPAFIDLIELAYLEGAQGVYTETRMGFDVDGVEVKARLDVGAKVIDWRGFQKNPFAG